MGILIAGGDHIVLRENRVRENQPGGEPSHHQWRPAGRGDRGRLHGQRLRLPGILRRVAAHNIIVKNTVLDNQPFDLVYDGLGTGNHFVSNTCDTSHSRPAVPREGI